MIKALTKLAKVPVGGNAMFLILNIAVPIAIELIKSRSSKSKA